MSTYFEFAEPSSQDISQDSRVPSQHKPMDISEDNEYYEDEVEDSAILDGGDEEVNFFFRGSYLYSIIDFLSSLIGRRCLG